MSVVLEVQPDAGYEPSEAETLEYGKWLGMELPDDMPLLWIAREGLKAPLPEHWKACKSEKGELYYFNFKTGQSIWDHPSDEHYRELLKTEKANLWAKEDGKCGKEVTSASCKSVPVHSGNSTKRRRSKISSTGSTGNNPKPQEAVSKVIGVKELLPIQQKKQLPESLKLATMPEDGKKSDKPTSTAEGKASPEFHPVASQSDSPLTSDAAKAPTINEPEVIPVPSQVVAGGGVHGLRALDKRSTSSSERAVSPSATHGKAVVDQQVSKELEEYRLQQQRHLRQQKVEIDSSVVQELTRYREEVNVRGEKERAAIDAKGADVLSGESAKLAAELESKLGSLRQEYEEKRKTEVERLRGQVNAQLQNDKRKIEADIAQMLEAFTREKRQESEIKKEAQIQALQEASKGVADMKHFLSVFLQEYEIALAAVTDAIQKSRGCFEQIVVQKQKELQEEMRAKVDQIREQHALLIQQEQDHANKRLETLRHDKNREVEELREAQQHLLQKMRDEFKEERTASQKEQLSHEHARFMETLTEIRISQAKELEVVKQQLKEKAQEELQAIIQELVKERDSRKSSLSVPQLRDPHEQIPCVSESRSPSPTDDEDDAGKGRSSPPRLDRKCLTSTSSQDGTARALTEGAPQPDIKALVTEALREVFAGSPFILPSPAQMGEARAASGTPAASAGVTVSSSRGGQDRHPMSSAASLMPHLFKSNSTKESGVFKLPLSIQEQRSLVEGERRRLQEGRKYVEQQQQYLEERKQQLRRRRHQWKQDVLAAKQAGVRSSSKRGKQLNRIRLALEGQAQGLEHDTLILRDSQVWLLSKEQRLKILERQIEEQERLSTHTGDEASALNNCSVDTAVLMTEFFKPRRHSGRVLDSAYHRDVMGCNALSSSGALPIDGYAASPVFSKALSRIERRLDEVTSIIHMQKHQALSQTVASFQAQSSSGRHRPVSPALREAVPGYGRRESHSNTMPEALLRNKHVEQWQAHAM